MGNSWSTFLHTNSTWNDSRHCVPTDKVPLMLLRSLPLDLPSLIWHISVCCHDCKECFGIFGCGYFFLELLPARPNLAAQCTELCANRF
jgi:hypothetical protein